MGRKKSRNNYMLSVYKRRYMVNHLNSIGIYKFKGKRLTALKSKGENGLNKLFEKYFNQSIDVAYKNSLPKSNKDKSKHKEKQSDNDGYIYVFANKEYGFCKIGYSENPNKRLRSVQTGCPFPLIIVAKYRGSEAIEKALHRKYRRYRIRKNGEWFFYEGELKRNIERM